LNQNKLAKSVGVTLVFAHQVVRGKRLPPLDQADRWADALRLQGPERREFLIRVAIEHSPPLIFEVIKELRDEIGRLQAKKGRARTR
jgi:hypothetical protein